jgi:uncharacterized membrane protein YkvA (DUF1232 family)
MNNEVAIPVPDLANRSSWLGEQSAKWSKDLKLLIREARVITLLLRHRGVPWHTKLIAACTLGYLLSPIQLIPSFIPVIGQLDDLAILFTGMKLLRILTPKAILAECESRADSSVSATVSVSPRTEIAVNHLYPDGNDPNQALWFTLPDVVASVPRTGCIP